MTMGFDLAREALAPEGVLPLRVNEMTPSVIICAEGSRISIQWREQRPDQPNHDEYGRAEAMAAFLVEAANRYSTAYDAIGSGAGDGVKAWRCFHCDDVFTSERDARLHFGRDEAATPACQIKGSEIGLVEALRRAENDASDAWMAIHNEATDAARAYHAQAARHRQQLTAIEQVGYDRGHADARAHPDTLGLSPVAVEEADAKAGSRDDYVLVPREPTEAMIDAADRVRPLPPHYLADAYRHMLAAALSTHTAAGAGPVGEAVAVPYDDFLAAYGFVPRSQMYPRSCLKSRLRDLLRPEDVAHADEAESYAARPVWEPGEAERLREYAREATKAITSLTAGGSEYFGRRIGDIYTADLPFCLERIHRSKGLLHSLIRDERSRAETAEAALTESEQNAQGLASDLAGTQAELDEMRAALVQIEGGHFPGAADVAISGSWQVAVNQLQGIARAALTGDAQDGEPGASFGARHSIAHDGFVGTVIGHYTRLDGKRGVVLQQDGTKVVHVYGEKWLAPAGDAQEARRSPDVSMWGRWFPHDEAPGGSYACLYRNGELPVSLAWMPAQGRPNMPDTVVMPFPMPGDAQEAGR